MRPAGRADRTSETIGFSGWGVQGPSSESAKKRHNSSEYGAPYSLTFANSHNLSACSRRVGSTAVTSEINAPSSRHVVGNSSARDNSIARFEAVSGSMYISPSRANTNGYDRW